MIQLKGSDKKGKYEVYLARESDRELIYQMRHQVYAEELEQHQIRQEKKLMDDLDKSNEYIVASISGKIAGFVSITSPQAEKYSIDKYFLRSELSLKFDQGLYEIRLLTVLKQYRYSIVAPLLMYAAFRWVESHGGQSVVAIGRRKILPLYLKSGLKLVGHHVQSGKVTYDLLTATVDSIRERMLPIGGQLRRIENKVDWQMPIPFMKPSACFHGGAFFDAIGNEFDSLERKDEIINADVLDAWFPPSPKVISAIQEHLPWLLKTSPPTQSEGLVRTISKARGINSASILVSGGSSSLVYLAFNYWLTSNSRVLILDPTYGEYSHILENVIGCRVDRFLLSKDDDYVLDASTFHPLKKEYDLIVIVNPNNPTGKLIPKKYLQEIVSKVLPQTLVWIDEAYIEYVDSLNSMESFAMQSRNVIVCKSLSKVYALSGARVAYLCASPHVLEPLKALVPPWAVSLPAQLAATIALKDPKYYEGCYQQTRDLRRQLVENLSDIGEINIFESVANFILCDLTNKKIKAETLVSDCRRHGLFLRDVKNMGHGVGEYMVRIAVKDERTNFKMVKILNEVLNGRFSRIPSARVM